MIENKIQFERIGLATEKSDILTGLPLNNSGTITGDSKMKRIPLTQGQFAIIDDDMFEYLNQWKWSARKTKYGGFMAIRTVGKRPKRKMVYMHRQIMNCPENLDVDHRDHNTLNNHISNLRICTRSQNLQNSKPRKNCTSIYKGVSWFRQRKYKAKEYEGKWRTQIMLNGKYLSIGLFKSEIEAAKAYDEKAKELLGEFAYLNFSTKTSPIKAR